MIKNITISYCITCMNRKWQLIQTLPYNLSLIGEDEEICLVNYNSKDGLDEYIKENFAEEINSKKLIYFYTKEPTYYHCPKAKNLSHRMSKGKWIFNLDADNFISQKTYSFTKRKINFDILHEFSRTYNGTYGRILIKRAVFNTLNGYNESFMPMATQDRDLLERAHKMGFKIIRNPINFKDKMPIKNSKENINGIKWIDMENYNLYILRHNLERNILVANPTGMTKFNGILNFEKQVII